MTLILVPEAQAQTAPQPGEIVINEIYYDPPDEQAEFVELYNRSDRAFDLRLLSFSDSNRDTTALAEAAHVLPPGGYAVLARDGAAFAAAFPDAAFIVPPTWHVLNNGGDAVILYGLDGAEIDAVPYAPGWGGSDNFASLERIDPAGPSDSAFNFGSSADPRGATPGARNSLFDPDETGPHVLFVEEAGPAAADVFFDEPVADPAPSHFALQGGRTPEHVHVLDDGTRVRLVFSEALGGPSLAVEGVRDRTGNAAPPQTVPLAYRARPGQLVVNEIMFAPLADDFDERPNQPEYVELLNTSARALSLRGLYWTDAPDERGEADTLRLGQALRAAPPGGYALAFADADDTALRAAFPETDFDAAGVALLPVDRSSLGLLNSGDLIALYHVGGQRLDSVRYDPDWHAPGLRDATGVALERLAPELPSSQAASWTSSVAEAGGTPGRPNSVALPPEAPPAAEPSLAADPSPFSPDGDGFEDVTRLRFTLGRPATLIRARIFDSYGRHVRTLEEARLAGRSGSLAWDGRGDAGHVLRVGVYVVLLEAFDAESGAARALKAPVVLARPLD